MARDVGPPQQGAHKRAPGGGLKLAYDPLGEPVVATAVRAAHMLGIDPDRLAEALAPFKPWGTAASGEPVWRFPELCVVAAEAGLCPPVRTRPTLQQWHDDRRKREQHRAVRKRSTDRQLANRKGRRGSAGRGPDGPTAAEAGGTGAR